MVRVVDKKPKGGTLCCHLSCPHPHEDGDMSSVCLGVHLQPWLPPPPQLKRNTSNWPQVTQVTGQVYLTGSGSGTESRALEMRSEMERQKHLEIA